MPRRQAGGHPGPDQGDQGSGRGGHLGLRPREAPGAAGQAGRRRCRDQGWSADRGRANSHSVIASRLMRAGAKAGALRRLVTERRRQAALLELAQHARRGDRDGQSAPVNDVYLPLPSATEARPIIVCARIAQRSLAVGAPAELDTRKQELGAGSPVAHAPFSPEAVGGAGGKRIRVGPS
jgi:hypothetical protein